jgi:hypothetical protein
MAVSRAPDQTTTHVIVRKVAAPVMVHAERALDGVSEVVLGRLVGITIETGTVRSIGLDERQSSGTSRR